MEYYNDNCIRLDYDPILHKTINYNNVVGPTKDLIKRTLDIVVSDENCVFVRKDGNDSTGNGTSSDPVATIQKANTLITSTKNIILIDDSGDYMIPYIVFSALLIGIYANIGCSPTLHPNPSYIQDNTIIEENINKNCITKGGIYDSVRGSVVELSNGNIFIGQLESGSIPTPKWVVIDKECNKLLPEQKESHNYAETYYACAFDGWFLFGGRDADDNVLRLYAYNNDFTVKWNQFSLVAPSDGGVISKIGTDRILVCRVGSYYTEYCLLNYDGGLEQAFQGVGNVRLTNPSHVETPDGGVILIGYHSTNYSILLRKISPSGVYTHSYDKSREATGIITSVIHNEKLITYYSKGNGNLYKIENSLTDLSLISDEVLLFSSGLVSFNPLKCCVVTGNNIAITLVGTGPRTYFMVFNENHEIIHTSYRTSLANYGDLLFNSSNNKVYVCYKYDVYNWNMAVFGGFLMDWIEFQNSTELTLNGIKFNGKDVENLRKILKVPSCSLLSIKWCELSDLKLYSSKDTTYK